MTCACAETPVSGPDAPYVTQVTNLTVKTESRLRLCFNALQSTYWGPLADRNPQTAFQVYRYQAELTTFTAMSRTP